MDISLCWLNEYLEPAGLTADEADHLLTDAGFPLDGRTPTDDGDVILDVEVTSNRGDCLSHIGCAREVAAISQARAAAGEGVTARTLREPSFAQPAMGPPIGNELTLENRAATGEAPGCPRFTARLIRNVKVGPSPDWLVRALESVGARSINNVVDVTNFITLELGNPCHVFDYDKLAGHTLVVRPATPGEKVKTLYAGEHELRETDLVVADAERPQSLAGVIGGHDSQVDAQTTTVVFEMATWDPVAVRNTGRRTGIRTDAAYRFERTIDPRTIDFAAERAVALICELSGGELADGVLDEGPAQGEPSPIALRADRCERVVGVRTEPAQIAELLTPLGVACTVRGDVVECAVPAWRAHDLGREIDLIEEVGRVRGLGVVPMADTIGVVASRPQAGERAVREIADVLTGLGFYETVTFSFTSPERGELFKPAGVDAVGVDDDRRGAEPTLRPSVLTGLLGTRATNESARNAPPGGVRLFETAAVFGQRSGTNETLEHRSLGMLADVVFEGRKAKPADVQLALRRLRGAIDAVVRACFGSEAVVVVVPAEPTSPGWQAGAYAELAVRAGDEVPLGRFGVVSDGARAAFGVDTPLVAAELTLGVLESAYPPKALAHALPQYPGIDRDVSLVLPEATSWAAVAALADGAGLDMLTGRDLVGVFRGEQVGAGKKSVTVRLFFRHPERTLRHEEVDPQVEAFTQAAGDRLGAVVRA